jgi:SAM-dependent methyltransferase
MSRPEDAPDPRDIVRTGYDRASIAYRPDDADAALPPFVGVLLARLPAGAAVLDLGCGNGLPVSRALADRFEVLGVDLSPVQIERARRLVPRARFEVADMTELRMPAASFDGVVATYSLIHVPLEDQPRLLRRIRGWLRPGGVFLATVGAEAWTGSEDDWLGSGARMWWSHADEATYLRWLAEAGFTILERTFVPEGAGGHVFVLAERPQKRAGRDSGASASG